MPTVQQQDKPQQFCPIIGGNMIPDLSPESLLVKGGGAQMPQMVWKMLGCIGEQCTFWNGEKSGCSIKIAADSLSKLGDLVEANKGKLSILNMLSGGKK